VSRDGRLAAFPDMAVEHDLRLDILPLAQRRLWADLGAVPLEFVLYGGTALALRVGHRTSLDFDFFSSEPFAPGDLLGELSFLGRVEVMDSRANTLTLRTPAEVKVSFFGGMGLRVVAEPTIAADTGVVVASIEDLAGTTAKALLDRSEWRDYVDIDALVRAGIELSDIIGCATTIFESSFVFPGALFLRSLVSFEDGTAPDVPQDARLRLETTVRAAWEEEIPVVEAYASHISPWRDLRA
jgi:hypothetical protein